MGNNQPKYLNSNEAIGIMGDKTWDRLRRQLRSNSQGGQAGQPIRHQQSSQGGDPNSGHNNGNNNSNNSGNNNNNSNGYNNNYAGNASMDYAFFSRIIQSQFEYIPRLLVESLFLGFANDLNSKVDIDEFISSLAVISGQSRGLILRIYDGRGNGQIERLHVEKIIKLAYGYRSSSELESLKKNLDLLFRLNAGNDMMVTTPTLSFKDFESAAVPIRELGEWVQSVLRIFTDPLPPHLLAMDKRYSSNLLTADIVAKYHVSEAQCTHLRSVFSHKCGLSLKAQPNLGKQELSLETWVSVTKDYLPSSLATMIFLTSTTSFKPIWRLEEFISFCLIYGRGSIDEQTKHLCQVCYQYYLRMKKSQNMSNPDAIGGVKTFFRRIILLLAQTNTNESITPSSTPTANTGTTVTTITSTQNNLSEEKSVPTEDSMTINSTKMFKLESLEDLQSSIFLPAVISESLDTLDIQSEDPPLQFYVDLLATYNTYLPGMRELEMTACCLFGVQPIDPSREKEFIMELMVKRQGQAPQTRSQPYGPVGTEWCVVVKSWWDNWRFFVGHKRVVAPNINSSGILLSFNNNSAVTHHNHNNNTNITNTSNNNSNNNNNNFINSNTTTGLHGSGSGNNLNTITTLSQSNPPPRHPGEIDNWQTLKKTGPKQLLQGTTLHNDIEVIPPSVYQALQMWYGGGPRIQRKVIVTSIGNIKASELELFPLCIKVCTCLPDGRAREPDREMLMSRMHKVSQIIAELSESRNVDTNRVRLWNYAHSYWKDQFVLSPDLTLEEANLQDGQTILLEISLNDGTWPRSQLHSQLDEEERLKQQKVEEVKSHGSGIVTKQPTHDDGILKAVIKLNDGRVGLDNLGNTCYLNASLQALLHTEPLVDYFLSQSYILDINQLSKFGYGGKLALSFGKLVEELYRSNKKNISPRRFVNDLASVHQQFGGNQQHDAQELLAFLLDGLSEDLNLVDEKPYTEQPDSDGRPDSELADIWWENHFKRDLSLIQALFTGQFKSVMTCSCGHSSARFEPFNILAVPIPEDFMRMFTVHVVFKEASYALLLTIRVDKRSDLYSVIEVINRLNLPIKQKDDKSTVIEDDKVDDDNNNNNSSSNSNNNNGNTTTKGNKMFVAVEIISSKVHAMFSLERKLEMIRDGDNIFLYETTKIHRGNMKNVRSLQLPPPSDPFFEYTKHVPISTHIFIPSPVPFPSPANISSSTGSGKKLNSSSTPTNNMNVSNNVGSVKKPANGNLNIVSPKVTTPTHTTTNVNQQAKLISNSSKSVSTNSSGSSSLNKTTASTASSTNTNTNMNKINENISANVATNPNTMRVQSPSIVRNDSLDSPSPPLSETTEDGSSSSIGIRVAFVQRRIRLQSSSGLESFTLDIFGLPFVHVFDSPVTGKELYDAIFNRVSPYLKANVEDLLEHYSNSANTSKESKNGLVTSVKPENNGIITSSTDSISSKDIISFFTSGQSISATADGLQCASNEEIFAGPISRTGFTLRLVVGGTNHCIGCGRCHWLSRCQGCVVPDNSMINIFLRDGETIAIDWHIAVFEELLDINAASEVRRHKSMNHKLLQDNTTPLLRCLDKFTEDEPLEGMVCPKCHNDDKLRKSFALWRLPPILVVQLKRFQFDNTSRRKLTNRVDFPIDNFDLSDYLASLPNYVDKKANFDNIEDNYDSEIKVVDQISEVDITSYDLYCTVHHIGALSGGHYIAAIKNNTPIPPTSSGDYNNNNNNNSNHSNHGSSDNATNPSSSSSTWWLYNDDVVSEIKDVKELCSSTAYLLFYVRKDILKTNAHDLFAPFRAKAPPRSRTTSTNDDSDRNRSLSMPNNKSNHISSSSTSRPGIMNKFMRPKSFSMSSNQNNSNSSTNNNSSNMNSTNSGQSSLSSSHTMSMTDSSSNSTLVIPMNKTKSLRRPSIEKGNKRNTNKSQDSSRDDSNTGCLPS